MASSKRKLLQPFKFRSSEEDNKRQYDALFGSPLVPLRPIPVPGSAIPPAAPDTIGVLETSPEDELQTSSVDVYNSDSVDVSWQSSIEIIQTPTVGVSQNVELRQFEDTSPLTAKKPVQRENWPTISSNGLETPTVGVSRHEPTEAAGMSQTPTGDVIKTPTAGTFPITGSFEGNSERTYTSGKTGESPTSASHGNISRVNQTGKTPTVGVLTFNEPAAVPFSQEFQYPQTLPAETISVDVFKTPTAAVLRPAIKQEHQTVNPPSVDSFTWFQSWDKKHTFDARGVKRISIVQDILSNVEFGYYRKLWEANSGDFRVLSKDENVKIFQAGYAALAKLLNMDRRSVARYIVDAFVAKQMLEVAEESQAASRTCTVYRLYSFREILARLRNAGCTYAKKHGKAVYLVRPLKESDFALPPIGVSQTPPVDGLQAATVDAYNPSTQGQKETSTVGKTPTVGETPTGSIGETPTGAVDVLAQSSLYRSYKENSFSKNVVEGLEKLILNSPFKNFDRNAISAIVKQSQDCVPDITPEEIFELFQEKARAVAGNRRIENFTGMMIWAWPGFFTVARVQSHREAVKKRREQERKVQQENLAMWREWLNDPQIPDEWKQVARDGLVASGELPG